MADNQRTLTANFVADTSGFSPKINELIQKLKTLNQDFEQNKTKVRELNAQIKEYEKELSGLNSKTNNGATANEEQRRRMQELRDSIAHCNVELGSYRAAQTNLRSQINATNRELTEQQRELNNASTSNAASKISDLSQRLKVLNQDFEQNKAKVRALSTQLREYEIDLHQLNSVTNNGATANEEQRRHMQELRDSISRCNNDIQTHVAAQINLRSQINATNRELTEQQQEFSDTSSAAATFGDVLKANLTSDFITSTLRKITDSLRQAAAYCYNVGSAFEAGMSKVEAISGATADELEQLTEKAKKLGAETRYTATEVSEAMSYMAMAGWDAQQMLEGIDGVISLAAASGSDLALTSDIVTDAITAFGLAAEDVGHFSNVLAAASANANTNVEMMGETFKYVAPIAGAMGYSIEDVAEQIGLMANSGIKSTMAGTALRTTLTKLSEGATITGEKIGEVSIQTANADGSMRELNEVITDLRNNFSQLTEEEKVANAENLAGKNALSGFLALMNASETDIEKLRGAIENCDGAAANMAETMQDNVSGAVTKFNSALEGVGNAIYGNFSDGLRDAVNIFTECLSEMTDEIDRGGVLGQSFEELGNSFKSAATEIADLVKDVLPDFVKGLTNALNFIITFRKEIGGAVTALVTLKAGLSIAGVVSKAVASITGLVKAVKAATTAQQAFNAALTKTPWGAIAVGVGLLVGAIADVASNAETAAEKVESLREASDEAARSAVEYADKADDLRDVKKRYDEIYGSEKSAYEKSQDLKALQDELIQQFPDLKGQIDLVTGAYKEQAAAIQSVIDEKNKDAKGGAIAAYNEMRVAEVVEERDVTNSIKLGDPRNDDRLKKLGAMLYEMSTKNENLELADVRETKSYFNITGSSEEKYEVYKAIKEAMEEAGLADAGGEVSEIYNKIYAGTKEYGANVEANKQILETYNRLVKGEVETDYAGAARFAEEWDKANSPYDDEEYEEAAVSPVKNLSDEERKKLYDVDKQLADDQYSVGEISAEEYYKRLKELRDKYLDEGTHEWYQATAQIQSVYDKISGGADKAANSVKSALSEVEMAYKKTLAAIDEEYEKHNREKADLEFQSKIDEIDRELQYGRVDEFEKYELEKQRQDLIDEHNEELYKRQYSDAKDTVTDAYNARQTLDKAEIGTKEYTIALGDYTDALGDLSEVMESVGTQLGIQNSSNSTVSNIDESTKNNYVNVILQAVNKSNSQIVDELLKALKSDL